MTASEIINALKQKQPGLNCPQWVRESAYIFRRNKYGKLYETTRAAFYTEVTVRVPAVKTAKRSGLSYQTLQRRRLDLVALVLPNYRAYEPLVVGVEIKVAEHDLLNDHKMTDYLNYAHLFYLAVPKGLLDVAQYKLDNTLALANAGVLTVDDAGLVTVKQAPALKPMPPKDAHLREIFAEMLIKPFKQSDEINPSAP